MDDQLNRRNFLKGAGVAIALPVMESLVPPALATVASKKPVKPSADLVAHSPARLQSAQMLILCAPHPLSNHTKLASS